jgi:anaerobic carbon-monoxide dehydrogenase iron sulfur subunit
LKHIVVLEALCSGCRACEVACVAHHEGRFGTASARIKVFKDESLGLDLPRLCRMCPGASCVSACPATALTRHLIAGTVLLDSEQCLCCTACADACSFGDLSVHPQSGLPLFCDLCDGDPACVKRCVTGALVYRDPDVAEDGGQTPLDGPERQPSRSEAHRA